MKTANKKAVEKMQNYKTISKKTGKYLVVGTGAGAGWATSGTIATACGASTFAGSTSLAGFISWAGLPLVLTTPPGWIAGAAVAGGALGYGAVKLIENGVSRENDAKNLSEKIKSFSSKSN